MIEANYGYAELDDIRYAELGDIHGYQDGKIQMVRNDSIPPIPPPTECLAVVLMFNPPYKKKAPLGATEDKSPLRIPMDEATGTLEIVMGIVPKIENLKQYVRIYNATTLVTGNREKLLEKNPNIKLFPEDVDLTPNEAKANWWIAWGSEADYPEEIDIMKRQQDLLMSRWETCLLHSNAGHREATGFEKIGKIYSHTGLSPKNIVHACASDKYLHPTLLKIKTKKTKRHPPDTKPVIDSKLQVKERLKKLLQVSPCATP